LKSAKSNVIPLQVKTEQRVFLLRHPKYRRQDTVNLALEAKAYVQGRLPCPTERPLLLFNLRVMGNELVRC